MIRYPLKETSKAFRSYGARPVTVPNSRGVSFEFPDGAVKLIPEHVTPGLAKSLIAWAQHRYGTRNERPIFDAAPTRERKPVIDLERCTASEHAKERLALMQQQQHVTLPEVLLALRAPQRILYSDTHGSWIWVGERIAVAAFVDNTGHTTIATVLWTSAELWAAAPRPEKAKTS